MKETPDSVINHEYQVHTYHQELLFAYTSSQNCSLKGCLLVYLINVSSTDVIVSNSLGMMIINDELVRVCDVGVRPVSGLCRGVCLRGRNGKH
jgi:hypothetical protein